MLSNICLLRNWKWYIHTGCCYLFSTQNMTFWSDRNSTFIVFLHLIKTSVHKYKQKWVLIFHIRLPNTYLVFKTFTCYIFFYTFTCRARDYVNKRVQWLVLYVPYSQSLYNFWEDHNVSKKNLAIHKVMSNRIRSFFF